MATTPAARRRSARSTSLCTVDRPWQELAFRPPARGAGPGRSRPRGRPERRSTTCSKAPSLWRRCSFLPRNRRPNLRHRPGGVAPASRRAALARITSAPSATSRSAGTIARTWIRALPPSSAAGGGGRPSRRAGRARITSAVGGPFLLILGRSLALRLEPLPNPPPPAISRAGRAARRGDPGHRDQSSRSSRPARRGDRRARIFPSSVGELARSLA